MKVIEHNGERIAIHIESKDIQEGLNFYSNENDFLQVGTWRYKAGLYLGPHAHNRGTDRRIDRTQEVVHIMRGALEADILSEEGKLLDSVTLQEGDTLILLSGGHGYRILKDDTMVLEIKNGPYLGPERDRRRIEINRLP
jgi:cupin fold WbuC family metalloprotein